MREYYPVKTARFVADTLDRTSEAVSKKARRMSLPKKNPATPKPNWTKEEMMFLREHYYLDSQEYIEGNLPLRTWKAIMCGAKRMGMTGDRDSRIRQAQLGKISDFELGYLVASIEDEGSIIMVRAKSRHQALRYLPLVAFANTDEGIVDEFNRIIHKLFSDFFFKSKHQGFKVEDTYQKRVNRKQFWHVRVSGVAKTLALLKFIRPCIVSINKKKAADLIMEWCESRLNNFRTPYSEEELAIADSVRALCGRRSR